MRTLMFALALTLVSLPANAQEKPDPKAAAAAAAAAADVKREALVGNPAPAIEALKVLNGESFDLAKLKGKVVVIDFWATWCPPCREVVPSLVEMQKEMGEKGVQVVGVTRYYGSGMDFAGDDVKLPHGGKRVGGRKPEEKLSEADEVKINENFIKAFGVNYPIVFSNDKVAGESYGVRGIPTVFVIGKDGKVVGSVVGGGKPNHEKLHKMIASAVEAKS